MNAAESNTVMTLDQPIILLVSNDTDLRHFIKDNFGEQYKISVCTQMLDFVAGLKWEDSVRLILVDYQDGTFDAWDIIDMANSTYPSLPLILLSKSQKYTDEIFEQMPEKTVLALYQPLELVRVKISEILNSSSELFGTNSVSPAKMNLAQEKERFDQQFKELNSLAEVIQKRARNNGFESLKSLRRFNSHLENLISEWKN